MVSAVEDVWNLALRAIKYPRRVANAYEGSEASKALLEIYGETRDELIRFGEWPFTYRDISLTLLKGPPPPGGYSPAGGMWNAAQYPPPGWLYEYLYPADMVELGAIVPPPGRYPIRDPRPAVWRVVNDPSVIVPPATTAAQAKVILTNVGSAVAVYRARITNPGLWEAGFTGTLVGALAKKLAQNPDIMKAMEADLQATGMVAERHQG